MENNHEYNFVLDLLNNGFKSKPQYDYRDNYYGTSKNHPDAVLEKDGLMCYISVQGILTCFSSKASSAPKELWDSMGVKTIVLKDKKTGTVYFDGLNEVPSKEIVHGFINKK